MFWSVMKMKFLLQNKNFSAQALGNKTADE